MPNRVYACVAIQFSISRHATIVCKGNKLAPLSTPGAMLFYLECRRTLKCLAQNLSTVTPANLEHWACTLDLEALMITVNRTITKFLVDCSLILYTCSKFVTLWVNSVNNR